MKVEPKTKADQEKMAIALHTLARRGSLVPRLRRSGVGRDHPQGHGRTASRHQGRHPEAHRTTSKPMSARRRLPTARRSRAPTEIDYTHKKQTGGTGQFARVKLRARAERDRQGQRVRDRDRRRHGAEGIHPGRRKGRQVGLGQRRADRLPDGRHEGHAVRRRLPRSRLVGDRVRNRVARGDEGRLREGRRQAARADHGRRSRDARRFRRRRHRRHQQPPRPDPRPGDARQRHGHPRLRAARQHVRLRQPAALDVDRAAHPTRCSSRITPTCRATSPTK